MISYLRRTLKAPIAFEGPGLHSGSACRAVLHPSTTGFEFQAGDTRIPATPDQVTSTVRCTCLGPISTVEHVLSALAGMGVTDALIEVSGGELPAAEGCAREYAQSIQAVGLVDIGLAEIDPPFARVYEVAEDGAQISVSRGEGIWRYEFHLKEPFDPPVLAAEIEWSPERYAEEIAPARTTVFTREIELAKQAGLGSGLDEASVLVIGPEKYENEARFPNEPARHKLLDLMGDLALSGVPVSLLNVVAERSGHKMNVALAAKIRAATRFQ